MAKVTPVSPFGGGSGGGGGGLHFRRPADVFVGNNLGACRTARNTYFNNTNNAAAQAQFVADRSLAVVLNPTNSGNNVFSTFIGAVGDTSTNANWVDRTDAVQGNEGSQGAFDLEIFINATAVPTPATPTGGSFVVSTGVLTPPAGTTLTPEPPGTGEDIYRAQARINPLVDTGTVTPTWSEWVERAHLSPGITHVEADETLEGVGTAADPLGVKSPILDMGLAISQVADIFTFDAPDPYTAGSWPASGVLVQFSVGEIDDPDDTDVTITVGIDDYPLTTFGGRAVRLHELSDDTQYIALGKGENFVLMGPADAAGKIVDITESSFPAPDEDAFERIFLDRRTPAAYMLHEMSSARTPVQGVFNTYSGNAFYLGYGSDDSDYPLSGQADISKFYWNTTDQQFREWRAILVSNGPPVYTYEFQTVHSPSIILGGNTGVWLGHTGGLAGLRNKLPQDGINATHRYIGITTNSTGTHTPILQELDNDTYVAAVDPVFTYDFVTVGLYGTGGTGGLTGAQVQALIDVGLANLVGGAPDDRNTLDELNDAIVDIANTTQRHWYLAGGSRNGRTAEYTAPASWPGIGNIVDGDAVTFDIPTNWSYNGSSALAIQIGTDLLNLVDVREGEPFLGTDVQPGATYRVVRDGTRWQLISTDSKAEIAAFLTAALTGNTETGITVTYHANTGKLSFVVTGGGGGTGTDTVFRLGSGVPANTLGADDDTYLDYDAGTFYVKASGTYVLRYTVASGGGGTGSRLRFGAGAPANTLGADDDSYYDTTNAAFYLRASGTYTLQYAFEINYAELSGATFTGAAAGITPVAIADFTRKDYVDDLITALSTRISVLEGDSVGSHTRYFGWDSDGVVSTADFAAANESTTDAGTLPPRTMAQGNAYIWFGVPEASGEPTEAYLSINTTNQLSTFNRQAGVTNDENGDAHIVYVTNELITYLFAGESIRIGYA